MMELEYRITDLLINEDEELEKFIPLLKTVVRIKEDTGEPYIVPARERLTQNELIALYLIGKYFSYELNKCNSPSASNKEIAEKLSLEQKITNARLVDLRKSRLAENVVRGKWKFNIMKLEDFLNDLLKKINDRGR